ncbi:trypsin epsilon-like [Plodia interpunctella]|uniref:trypsin epsilon-like n=1 Tax=Plodia interpunctella TaxID=58824 RepID=UPI002368D719|nr:trypsin epsilon-like [Plodia interpunctella]
MIPKADIFQNYGYPRAKNLPILNRKIFKGARVTIREHPYVVSIRRLYSHYMPGTLISHNLVLSVAHPLYRVSTDELGIVAGENYSDRGTSINPVVLVIIHEDFDNYTLNNDISIVRTYEDFFISTNVKPIKLHNWKAPHLGSQAFVTGWGRCDFTGRELCLPRSNHYYPREVQDPMLRTVTFIITNNSFCNEYSTNEVPLRPGMMCMGTSRYEEYMTSCMAVPGAPTVVHGRLTGILSWGIGCGYTFDMPLVYVDLFYYRRWLHHNVEILDIPKHDLSMFYLATKSYVLQKFLNHTQAQDCRKPINGDEHDLQMYDIDLQIANTMGTVYDIRDFIYHGRYHKQKQRLYSKIKQSYAQTAASATAKSKSKSKSLPFLSKDKMRNLGFHIGHDGTISEIDEY